MNSAVPVTFRVANVCSTSEHVTSSQTGVEYLSTLEQRRVSSLTFPSFTPGSQALSTPNFPVDGGLEQGSLGWTCWRFCGVFAAKGEDFCQQKFPNVEMNWLFLWDEWLGQPWRKQTVCVSFAPGAGWKWLEDSIYARLLIQFSVFSFPGFNNADFCGPKRLQFKAWFAECEFRRLTEFRWCFMLVLNVWLIYFWLFSFVSLFLCQWWIEMKIPLITLNTILAASALTGYRISYILIYFEPNFFYKLTYPRVFLDLRDLFTACMLASCNGKLSTWSTAFVWLQDHFESFALHKATVHFDTLGWYDTSNPRIGPSLSDDQHPKKHTWSFWRTGPTVSACFAGDSTFEILVICSNHPYVNPWLLACFWCCWNVSKCQLSWNLNFLIWISSLVY